MENVDKRKKKKKNWLKIAAYNNIRREKRDVGITIFSYGVTDDGVFWSKYYKTTLLVYTLCGYSGTHVVYMPTDEHANTEFVTVAI